MVSGVRPCAAKRSPDRPDLVLPSETRLGVSALLKTRKYATAEQYSITEIDWIWMEMFPFIYPERAGKEKMCSLQSQRRDGFSRSVKSFSKGPGLTTTEYVPSFPLISIIYSKPSLLSISHSI